MKEVIPSVAIGFFVFAMIGLAFSLFPWWTSAEGAEEKYETQDTVVQKIHAIEKELHDGFDLFSQIKQQELSANLERLKTQLASEFFVSNQTNRTIVVSSSYLNRASDEWQSSSEQEVMPGQRVKAFARFPLFGSDRTIFVDSLPFMFMCTNGEFATVTLFRRGGIVFPFTQPDTKTFEYDEGIKYIVTWKQNANKALGVFDVFVEVEDV